MFVLASFDFSFDLFHDAIMQCIDSVCFSLFLDLFQDLSQLQETWLTEGETCRQAGYALTLGFSSVYDSH